MLYVLLGFACGAFFGWSAMGVIVLIGILILNSFAKTVFG